MERLKGLLQEACNRLLDGKIYRECSQCETYRASLYLMRESVNGLGVENLEGGPEGADSVLEGTDLKEMRDCRCPFCRPGDYIGKLMKEVGPSVSREIYGI